jgi:hypothetical protein
MEQIRVDAKDLASVVQKMLEKQIEFEKAGAG